MAIKFSIYLKILLTKEYYDFELIDNDIGAFYPFRLVATALRDINGQTDWPSDPYPISLDTFRSLLQHQ